MKTFVATSLTCLVLTVLIALGVGKATLAQHVKHTGNGRVKVTQLSQRRINEKLDGKECSATMLEVTFEPGQKDSAHRHAGPVFGYVLEGEYEHAVDDEGSSRTSPERRSTSRRDVYTAWLRTQALRTVRDSWR